MQTKLFEQRADGKLVFDEDGFEKELEE